MNTDKDETFNEFQDSVQPHIKLV